MNINTWLSMFHISRDILRTVYPLKWFYCIYLHTVFWHLLKVILSWIAVLNVELLSCQILYSAVFNAFLWDRGLGTAKQGQARQHSARGKAPRPRLPRQRIRGQGIDSRVSVQILKLYSIAFSEEKNRFIGFKISSFYFVLITYVSYCLVILRVRAEWNCKVCRNALTWNTVSF